MSQIDGNQGPVLGGPL